MAMLRTSLCIRAVLQEPSVLAKKKVWKLTKFHSKYMNLAITGCLICLFGVILYIPVNNFSIMLGHFSVFLGVTCTKQRTKYLAPVCLELVTL